eukprot:TRINITY_DN25363_c0_g1_i2.p1 TRINITY_DN25363_c0_g1~~TRINITY_DN25363_c0_g1_i2.p1  ORF type:complete len:548 (+),score=31.37 TRINITY_DN25363_c0_g1_i2:76-1719(+)
MVDCYYLRNHRQLNSGGVEHGHLLGHAGEQVERASPASLHQDARGQGRTDSRSIPSLQAALLAFAYRGDPEAFTAPEHLENGDAAAILCRHGATSQAGWCVTALMARCLALWGRHRNDEKRRKQNLASSGGEDSDAASILECLEVTYDIFLRWDWRGVGGKEDLRAPLFRMAYLASVVTVKLAGHLDLCESEQHMRLLRLDAQDNRRWSDYTAGWSRAQRRAELSKMWHTFLRGAPIRNISRCPYMARVALYGNALYQGETLGHLEVFDAIRSLLVEFRLNLSANALDAFRSLSPVWQFLVGWELQEMDSTFMAGALMCARDATSHINVVEAGVLDAYDTVKMCAAWPSARIYGAEPVKFSLELARERVREDGHCGHRLELHHLALSNASGEVAVRIIQHYGKDIYGGPSQIFDPTPAYLSTVRHLVVQEKQEIVTALSLDAFIEKLGLERIDFLRLDLNGAEYLVLSTAASTLAKVQLLQVECMRPGSIVAAHTNRTGLRSLRALLRPHGFRLLWSDVSVPGVRGTRETGDALFASKRFRQALNSA